MRKEGHAVSQKSTSKCLKYMSQKKKLYFDLRLQKCTGSALSFSVIGN